LKNLDTENIESMNVLKNKNATDKYGDKGKNGVIEITTKKLKTVMFYTKSPLVSQIHPQKLLEKL